MQFNSARKYIVTSAALIIPILIYSLPILSCYYLWQVSIYALRITFIITSPLIFTVLFALTAGCISRPFQSGIIPGKFPRENDHAIYSKRKIYGICWTTVFYCKPIYFLILSIPSLKKFTFKLFGYKGDLNFTVYPDCWIRDLCLLDFGKNVYISNRATIGTNICHIDNTISVGKISIGDNSIIGHLTMVAHGVKIGSFTEIGVGSGIGIRVNIGSNVNIGPMSMINHFANIGNNVSIGTRSYVGAAAIISDNIQLPAGILIPDKARVLNPGDVNKYLSSTYLFNKQSSEIYSVLAD